MKTLLLTAALFGLMLPSAHSYENGMGSSAGQSQGSGPGWNNGSSNAGISEKSWENGFACAAGNQAACRREWRNQQKLGCYYHLNGYNCGHRSKKKASKKAAAKTNRTVAQDGKVIQGRLTSIAASPF